MSPMSEMAALAAGQALMEAGLVESSEGFRASSSPVDPSRIILILGSTTGSPFEMEEYFKRIQLNNGISGQSGTSFFKVMNHSVASNVAVALGFNGAVVSPSCACATSAQAAVVGWEFLKSGLYDVAICGGADELHYLSVAVFDSVYAASRRYHDHPQIAPRPFDVRRDGLVVSEGGSVLVLESERSLQKRGRKPQAEFCGGAHLCESSHMSQSNEAQMVNVIRLALERSQIDRDEVGYVNAHATGTLQGDAAEAGAIRQIFGDRVPVSSLKGHFGHSMAACGAAEVMTTISMMEDNLLIGTKNLEEIAPECSGVWHLKENLQRPTEVAISNNFAFGGINTSILIRKC